MRDHGLADRIRAKGVTVVEVAGWHDRGDESPFTPLGAVAHDTVGSATGTIPSLGILISGRSDLPGPLAQVGQSREKGEGNDKAYVIASGRANHAGKGGWRGLTGNSSVEGLEVEHTGSFPLPAHRIETACRIHAAMLEAPGAERDAAFSCQHSEWAPDRKIDISTRMDAVAFRARVAFWIGRTAEEEDMPLNEDDKTIIRNILRQELYGDHNAADKGLTPIVRREVRAIIEEMLQESGGVTRTKLRELAKLGAQDAAPVIAKAVNAPPAS